MLRQAVAALAVASLVWAPAAQAQRTKLKPGWNLFSPQQDVEIGKQVSADAEKQLQMLNDAKVDRYLDRLGKRLAAKAPGAEYPYQFKGVNDLAINAFALPGGYMYVNRGTIEAAENESQLAGVMAHEISHVALRHGTNQASKAYAAQVPLAILGGLAGSGIGGVLAQIGAGFAANSVLLKFSRDAETQADVLGTQILYDNGYDPKGMSQFFQKLDAESKGGRPPQFFSSHPNPENRYKRVDQEIARLGGLPRNAKTDSAEFREIKRYVQSLPKPSKSGAPAGSAGAGGSASPGRVADPSAKVAEFENRTVRFRHPSDWKRYGEADAVWLIPDGGAVNQSVAYGLHASLFEPREDRYGQITLDAATDQLIEQLRRGNPNMRVSGRSQRVRVGGQRGFSTILTNDSPVGGRETDWLITVLRPEGLVYFVFVAPENDFQRFERSFEQVLQSVSFK
jgi:Zn-dependent protease with chaperone function